MIFATVAGTVVSTRRSDSIPGAKYLLLEQCTHRGEPRGEPRGEFLVALDELGAGPGEMVLVSQGSSARQTPASDKKPIDAVVAGLVDLVEERGEIVYRK